MTPTPSRKTKAFTLLELIVVIVVLGILAAIAIPTFAAVIKKSEEKTAIAGAESYGREAIALAAFEAETVFADDAQALKDADVDATGLTLKSHDKDAGTATVNVTEPNIDVILTFAGTKVTGRVGESSGGSAPVAAPAASSSARFMYVPADDTMGMGWLPVEGATSYEVSERVGGGAWEVVYTGPGTGTVKTAVDYGPDGPVYATYTTYTPNGYELPNTMYEFQVVSINDAGRSDPSAIAQWYSYAEAPTNLTASRSGNIVTLDWDALANGGARSYEMTYTFATPDGPVTGYLGSPDASGTSKTFNITDSGWGIPAGTSEITYNVKSLNEWNSTNWKDPGISLTVQY